ncbi:twin-arginine translocase subunit TatC [Pacificimonas sp. ICDLI1SI03]|jgi:sec-independent protein translocase protein TatC|tara:strand:- start:99666 stop:100466 length:801 start_codon:yes stop_codon:yes gene_type:complete
MSDSSEADELDASKAPLLEHLIELRTRLLWSVGAFLIAFFLAFSQAKWLISFIAQPLRIAYERIGQPDQALIYTKLYEAFFTEVKVSMFAAFLIAFPVIANQIWRFIAPGLYRNEKRAMLPFLIMTPVLFFSGAALAYFAVMPTVYTFLLSFQGETGGVALTALPAVGDYLSFAMSLIFAFGACFLVPVALMLLARVGIINVDQLVSWRRYAIVIAFVISALVTPPDIISQFMLAVPMIILYEGSIIAIRFTQKREAKAQALAALD